MILDDVADCSGLIVESATTLDTKILRHSYLHALDIVAVPEGFHESVCETKDDHIMHRPLAEIVADPENRRLVELSEKNLVEMLRGLRVVTERLLDDDPSIRRTAAIFQLFEHLFEHCWWDREIVCWPLDSLQFLAKRLKSSRIVVIPIN